jgi:hypothetical protein
MLRNFDSRVKCTACTAHILLDDLCNHTNILNDILAIQLALLDSLQDSLGSRFECKTSISISGDLILLGELGLGLDERVTSSSDGIYECLRVGR